MQVLRKAIVSLGLTTLAVLGLSVAPGRAQTTVVIGSATDNPNVYPFGEPSQFPPPYLGEYQQVYTSSALAGLGGGPVSISSIAFQSKASGPSPQNVGTIQQSLTYAFYYTSAGIYTLSTVYAANRGASLASYTRTGSFTSLNNGTFDFVLPAGFVYNPAQGNLLLDVNVDSESGNAISFAFGGSNDTSRVFNSAGSGPSLIGEGNGAPAGLQTQFTAAPEPPQGAALALGAAGLAGLGVRGRRRAAGPAGPAKSAGRATRP